MSLTETACRQRITLVDRATANVTVDDRRLSRYCRRLAQSTRVASYFSNNVGLLVRSTAQAGKMVLLHSNMRYLLLTEEETSSGKLIIINATYPTHPGAATAQWLGCWLDPLFVQSFRCDYKPRSRLHDIVFSWTLN